MCERDLLSLAQHLTTCKSFQTRAGNLTFTLNTLPNYTLLLPVYAYFNTCKKKKTVQGATTGDEFLDFFGQAMQNVDGNGNPILRNRDCVVVDNCPTHHGQYGRILRQYLGESGVELLYTPKYSPEFNPAEFAFNKIRTLSRQKIYRDMLVLNVRYSIFEMVQEITPSDCLGFFRAINYLNV